MLVVDAFWVYRYRVRIQKGLIFVIVLYQFEIGTVSQTYTELSKLLKLPKLLIHKFGENYILPPMHVLFALLTIF